MAVDRQLPAEVRLKFLVVLIVAAIKWCLLPHGRLYKLSSLDIHFFKTFISSASIF